MREILAKYLLTFIFALALPSVAFCDVDGRLYRCEPFREAVVKILKENGLSDRFYFLMVAESGCRSPDVTSEKGAVGFWQLMPATARANGCNNPEDFECATRAASRYLRHLLDEFHGDFLWTVAAYNAGGSNLKKATGYHKGMGFDIVKYKRPAAYALALTVQRMEAEYGERTACE